MINLAAQAGVDTPLRIHPYIESNIIGLVIFLSVVESTKLNIYFMRSSVYGGNKNLPFRR